MAPSTCSPTERYVDLWEVPMLQFVSAAGTMLSSMVSGRWLAEAVWSMHGGWWVLKKKTLSCPLQDPTDVSAEALLAQMMEQFNYSYSGNRAPFGLHLHTPWCAVGRAWQRVAAAAHCKLLQSTMPQ